MYGFSSCRTTYKTLVAILLKLLIILEVTLSNGLERKLTAVKNPGCEEKCNNFTFLHVRADGPNDSLHYLWDFTSKPTVLIAQTSNNASLTISWYDFLWNINSISVKFSEEPKYTFGVIFDKIWEFNDMNDTGVMTEVDDANIVSIVTNEFQWQLVDLNTNSSDPYLKMRSSNGPRDGSIDILVRPYGSKDHGIELPHLFHSPNSSQLDISINNFETNPKFNSSRFAFGLVLFSQDNKKNETFKIISRKSLDDEHTPGVFTMNDLVSPHATANSKGGGWLLWRKVSYTSEIRDIVNSTEVNEYAIKNVADHSEALNNTVIYSFHGYNVNDYLVQATNVSFGSKQDVFYSKNNFTTWTLLVGYGYPLEDELSLLVILVISIGLGLPALLILIGGYQSELRLQLILQLVALHLKILKRTLLVGYGYPLEDELSLLVILVISIGLGLPALLILIGGIYIIHRGFSSKKDELFLSR
ncbi:hypothetical protein J437_LFUL000843 [Ladona fulva]|uniref:Uncharacterized protein n=1 Tax=Ladona fulva TaxID=123851 RepID=A0A8K0JTN1_LADFU|nr:hypothetical protein J437_LFUL000843 [Ladona fulva]